MYKKSDVTFVIIGRNEAKNLERCFKSVQNEIQNIIFVDSNNLTNFCRNF